MRPSSLHVISVCNQEEAEDESDLRNSELIVVTEKINSDTEFIIIGSSGIWEVRSIKNHHNTYTDHQSVSEIELNRLILVYR